MQEIICVLDGSGSMSTVAGDALGGFNQFLEDQKAIGPANITIVWFDDVVDILPTAMLSDTKPLSKWRVGGSTALYDAIGKAFSHVSERFSKEKPEKVILAIQTDGYENSSKEYTQASVKALIEDHESKYGWTVLYMGAGLDSINQALAMGVNLKSAFAYDANQTQEAFRGAYSTAVSQART